MDNYRLTTDTIIFVSIFQQYSLKNNMFYFPVKHYRFFEAGEYGLD